MQYITYCSFHHKLCIILFVISALLTNKTLLVQAMQAAKKLPPFNEESLDFDIATLEESAFAMGKLIIVFIE